MAGNTNTFGVRRSLLLRTLFLVAGLLTAVLLPTGTATASTFAGVNGKVYFVDGVSGNVRTVNADGTNAQTVLNSQSDSVSLSPNGKKIAFENFNGSSFELHIADFDGSNDITVPNGHANDYHPSWSPDGSKLAFQCNNGSEQICITNLDGTGRTQLTNEALDNDRPSWSPDGQKIVYQKTGGSNGLDIYVMNADGSGKTALANTSAHEQEPRWSPDGTKIVYSRFTDNTYKYEIYQMNSNGSSQTRLTNHTEQDARPMYSPDGTKIYFMSESDVFGAYKLYRMDPDGSNLVKINNTVTASYFEAQPLTLGPTASNANPTITVTGGTATIDIPALYSEPYGQGVNAASVVATSTPSYGSVAVNGSGVITYTQTQQVTSRSVWSRFSSIFFPKVSAAAVDSFSYQVCSQASASLCSTGTVTVNVLGASIAAPKTGYGSSGNQIVEPLIIGVILAVLVVLIVKRKKSLQNRVDNWLNTR